MGSRALILRTELRALRRFSAMRGTKGCESEEMNGTRSAAFGGAKPSFGSLKALSAGWLAFIGIGPFSVCRVPGHSPAFKRTASSSMII